MAMAEAEELMPWAYFANRSDIGQDCRMPVLTIAYFVSDVFQASLEGTPSSISLIQIIGQSPSDKRAASGTWVAGIELMEGVRFIPLCWESKTFRCGSYLYGPLITDAMIVDGEVLSREEWLSRMLFG
jgi:hypothetical protein